MAGREEQRRVPLACAPAVYGVRGQSCSVLHYAGGASYLVWRLFTTEQHEFGQEMYSPSMLFYFFFRWLETVISKHTIRSAWSIVRGMWARTLLRLGTEFRGINAPVTFEARFGQKSQDQEFMSPKE